MSGDQASGLRQWSQAHGSARDIQVSPVELVVMSRDEETADLDALAQRLTLPEGVSHWQPRPLVLSAPLPSDVPDSPWWVLHLCHLEAHSAPGLAEALRLLHHAGMPQSVLLSAPDRPWRPGLIHAARVHLGVTLMCEVATWHQAVMAPRRSG